MECYMCGNSVSEADNCTGDDQSPVCSKCAEEAMNSSSSAEEEDARIRTTWAEARAQWECRCSREEAEEAEEVEVAEINLST